MARVFPIILKHGRGEKEYDQVVAKYEMLHQRQATIAGEFEKNNDDIDRDEVQQPEYAKPWSFIAFKFNGNMNKLMQ